VVNVVITGGAGFLGSRLARELLAAGPLVVAGGEARPLSRMTLIDQAPVPPDLAADERVTAVHGDLVELLDPAAGRPDTLAIGGTGDKAEVIFHLAAAVSGECEGDFDLGIRANLRATEALLASCRALGTSPLVVFSSSLAVFGGSGDHPLPEVVDDQTLPNPQTSYGAQKVIGEQLLADYTRKGFLRGRALRLVSVSVRPGPASARPARSARTPRSRWPRRPRPSPGCGAPPRPATRPGAAAARSTCPRSPSPSRIWQPRCPGSPARRSAR
jgi:D-erythronate 2-dehydrogenase